MGDAMSRGLIVPGRDPEVFVRFAKLANGVARIESDVHEDGPFQGGWSLIPQ